MQDENVNFSMGSNMEFLDYYELLTAAQVAEAVRIATGVSRTPDAVRAWAMALRKGEPLPDWLEPQLPAVLRVLAAEVARGGQ